MTWGSRTRARLRLAMGLVGVALAACLPGAAWAQSSHYWSNQFGNRSRLLSGAVIGSVDDLSAVYYNPGALALLEKPQFLLAGNVYRYTYLRVRDGLGTGQDLGSTRLVGVAPLLAGRLNFDGLGKSRLAYSFLTRQSVDVQLDERATVGAAELFGIPNLGAATASVRVQQTLGEFWAGLSWAYPVAKRVGLGASAYVAVRGQKTLQQLLVEGKQGDAGLAGLAVQSRDYSYRHVRLLAKVGAYTDLGTWRFGASFTSPGLGLWGYGETGVDSSLVSQGTEPSRVTSNLQKGLSAAYHSPLSVGAGVSRAFGGTRVHVAAEWFAPVGRYHVLDSRPVPVEGSDRELDTDVVLELDDVLNFAVGLEQRYSESLDLYLGFNTDVSAVPVTSDVGEAISAWNLYHFAAGASFQAGRYDVTLGGVFAFGDTARLNKLQFIPGDDIGPRLETTTPASVEYFRVTLVIGLSILSSNQGKSTTPPKPVDNDASMVPSPIAR
ncbi:hypothetical protein P2318_08720 [Myxococcaceae bacterium GXIMD 01537]